MSVLCKRYKFFWIIMNLGYDILLIMNNNLNKTKKKIRKLFAMNNRVCQTGNSF